ncbi:MAG: MarR family winged helix-turn-helix transcriptional regulator [Anaerolineae bacterium]|nr:MarR family winged helix-turn-helix transcriptional regulator [Anaerolineae bacterium]
MNDTPFALDPQTHHGNTASKILFALERLSHLFRIHWWEQNQHYQLSPLQMQLLIILRFQPELAAVSALARYLELADATVSDAVRILHQKGLVEKRPNTEDGRRQTLSLSENGDKIATELAQFANQVRDLVLDIPNQGIFLESLLLLMQSLQRNNFIPMQQMCTTCRHFQRVADGSPPYYCHLLNKPLAAYDLRVHCPEHEVEAAR